MTGGIAGRGAPGEPGGPGADRAALFLDDILSTPDVLDAVVGAYAAPGGPLAAVREALDERRGRAGGDGRPLRVVLTGMGSSRFAALAVAGGAAGTDGVAVELASARSVPPGPDTVLVGISNSGRTPEVVAAIRQHRGTSLTIGVTDHPERAVGADADVALPLLVGGEASGIASRSYAASIAVIAMLVAELRGGDVAATAADLRAGIAAARILRDGRVAWLTAAADALDATDEIHVIGDGRTIGTLEQAALMLREAPRLRALPSDAGDWLHVALYTLLPGSAVLLFTGTAYDAEIAGTVTSRGGHLVAVGSALDGATGVVPLAPLEAPSPFARAIAAAGVAELLAAELWQRVSREGQASAVRTWPRRTIVSRSKG